MVAWSIVQIVFSMFAQVLLHRTNEINWSSIILDDITQDPDTRDLFLTRTVYVIQIVFVQDLFAVTNWPAAGSF